MLSSSIVGALAGVRWPFPFALPSAVSHALTLTMMMTLTLLLPLA